MNGQTAWTPEALKGALEGTAGLEQGEISLRLVEGAEPVLVATLHQCGDLEVFVSASEEQIAASVLLWPVDEQEDRAAFNEFLLKAQKIVPLSNFGIATVGGRDYYELFGELAASSTLADIVTEIRTLGENAIEVASDLRSSFQPAAS